jgi:hypothetical protein
MGWNGLYVLATHSSLLKTTDRDNPSMSTPDSVHCSIAWPRGINNNHPAFSESTLRNDAKDHFEGPQ